MPYKANTYDISQGQQRYSLDAQQQLALSLQMWAAMVWRRSWRALFEGVSELTAKQKVLFQSP